MDAYPEESNALTDLLDPPVTHSDCAIKNRRFPAGGVMHVTESHSA